MKKVVLKNLILSDDKILSFEESRMVLGGGGGDDMNDREGTGTPPNGMPTCLCDDGITWVTKTTEVCPCWCIWTEHNCRP